MLDETLRTCIATDVLVARLVLDQFFYAQHEGCHVRAKARSLRGEGTKVARWVRVVETKRTNKATIWPLGAQNGRDVF